MVPVADLYPPHYPCRFTVRDAFQGVPHEDVPAATGTVIKSFIPRVPPGGSMASLTKNGHDNLIRPFWDSCATTIRKTADLTGLGCFIHPDLNRFLSIPEYKRLQSFPDRFIFPVGYVLSKNQIGNSVPPLMIRAIASEITKHLRFIPVPPKSFTASRDTLSYPAVLDAAWADHLAPRLPDAPTVISLFAGCGGSSLGYSMAGFRELLAAEWDPNACQTFRANFPGVPVFEGDIKSLSGGECLRLAGIKPGELDVLDGSPPCQGFSTSGKRDFDDSRNSLFKEFVRLLRVLKPKVFVMENVSGMVKGKMKLIFVEILRELKASGYQVKARLLNAMYYGVPQSRERVIFIGVRDDLGIQPDHPPGSPLLIPVTQAIIGCPAAAPRKMGTRAANLWHQLLPGQNESKIHGPGKSFSLVKVNQYRPSPAVLTVQHSGKGLMHWSACRFLIDPELARIGSFPDRFVFSGNQGQIAERIGNSVPPLFMRSIANHIQAIFRHDTGHAAAPGLTLPRT